MKVAADSPTKVSRIAWGLALPSLATATIVTLPLIYLFVRAWEVGWHEYRSLLLSAATLRLLGDTLLLVVGVVSLALALALPAAWLVARTDLPGRRIWAVIAALPLVFPSYVAALSLVAVVGPRGYVQGWLQPLGVELLPGWSYGYTGALLSLALFTYPYIYLPLVATLRDLDPALEESARSLGAGAGRCWWGVILPQLRPAMLGGSLLVTLYTISDFGAVSIVRYNTLTLGVFQAYSALFDRRVAAALASVLVMLALLFVLAEERLQRRMRATRRRATRPALRARLGRWRIPALCFLSALALLTVAMPTGLAIFWGMRGLLQGNALGNVGIAVVNSAMASGAAAFIAGLLALPLASWAVRHPGVLSRTAERLSYSGNSLPGLVVALALVFFVTRFLGPLYQTMGVLIAAYVIRFLPEAVMSVRGSLANLAPVFEEAARSLGRTPIEVLRSVTLPLIRPGLLAGVGLVFLTSMKELPATLILRPIGFETLATRIWSTAAEGVYSEAALPTLLLLAVTVIPVHLLFIRPMLATRD